MLYDLLKFLLVLLVFLCFCWRLDLPVKLVNLPDCKVLIFFPITSQ